MLHLGALYKLKTEKVERLIHIVRYGQNSMVNFCCDYFCMLTQVSLSTLSIRIHQHKKLWNSIPDSFPISVLFYCSPYHLAVFWCVPHLLWWTLKFQETMCGGGASERCSDHDALLLWISRHPQEHAGPSPSFSFFFHMGTHLSFLSYDAEIAVVLQEDIKTFPRHSLSGFRC